MTVYERDVSGMFHAAKALDSVTATAGGSGDNAEQLGPAFDRRGYSTAMLVVHVKGTIGASANMAITAKIKHSATSGGTYADYATKTLTVVDGADETGIIVIPVNLDGANNWLKASVTVDLSAANTDTAIISAVWLVGGARQYPVT